jgi:pimeloyl-ACP methyl ester carboxylesterase
VLDAVGVGQVILWGATDGGPLAIAFAVQHPDRVAGLVLVGTTPRLLCSTDFGFGIAPSVMDSFLRRDAVDRGGAVGELLRARPLEPGEAIGEVMKRVPQRAWSGILGALGFADARLFLPQVRAPTLIVHDEDNQYIPVEAAHYLHERIPDSQLEITEEAGTPLLGDALFSRIQGFIEAAAARSDV